ncbi:MULTISPECIES: low molecular weight protein tyrosine phosphatase family protein [unclassified Aureispira]|uniref:low molecular weight protein tyrosine phosphatase family protein n=1 Tax=unclassified Aureispira TaxID=2649989 RepID=UPI0006987B9A|nr:MULTISPECIES: protein-tyrosine-phosphatase [unclassified Aureispira]WMX13940.1 protein tyrosine phosphatase [Aureispira sp. CCB-E]
MIKVLFVCSKNKWRSRTAETIFKNRNGLHVRSAGTERSAQVRLTQKMIEWAEVIFVMENKHKSKIQQRFRAALQNQDIVVLDIPDLYPYMDEELIQLLEDSINYYFEDV